MSRDTFATDTTSVAEINITLDTGTTIQAVCASVEEAYMVDSICTALKEYGAKVVKYNVINRSEVSAKYERKFRGINNECT